MTTRAIVIFPKLPPAHPIQHLRRRFDPLADAVPPHVTLVFPFDGPSSADELQQHMAQAAQHVPPFELHLMEITGQNNEYLFLNVKRGNDELIALHDRLYTGPIAPHFNAELTYTPHLTVGRLPDLTAFRAALHEARRTAIELQTLVDEIMLYRIETDGNGCIEHCVQLSRRAK